MMTDMVDSLPRLLTILVSGIVGYAAGTIVSYRRARLLGHSWVLPVVERSTRNFTIVVLTLSLLTVTTVVQSAVDQAEQERCNTEFRRVLAERAATTAEDTAVNVRDKAALDDAVQQLIDNAASGGREASLSTLQGYLDQREESREIQRANEERRAQNPYPEPRCD